MKVMYLQNDVYMAKVGWDPADGWFIVLRWKEDLSLLPIMSQCRMEDRKVLFVLKHYGFGYKLQDVKVQLGMRGDL